MTTRKPLLIGPFSKGLNTYDDPTAIDDRELVEALNFDPGFDGSLRSRPPFTDTGTPLPLGASGTPRILGYYYNNNNVPYLIASDGLNSTWQYNGVLWTLITSTFSASDMVQFDGKAWLLAPVGEDDPGGSWDPSTGFVADSDMPKGTSIASYKSRLWVAQGLGGNNPTRLYYSKALGQPSFWASPGFIDVGAGDGESVVKVVQYFDTLLLFRTKSIWSFQYGIDPATATQGILVPGVGLQSNRSIVPYENYLYFMYDEKAYQFINNRVQQINIKVPFRAKNLGSTDDPFHVSLFNNRILYSYYEMIYVYSLRTQTWTTWRSDAWGPIGQVMSSYVSGDTDEAYAIPSAPDEVVSSYRVNLAKNPQGGVDTSGYMGSITSGSTTLSRGPGGPSETSSRVEVSVDSTAAPGNLDIRYTEDVDNTKSLSISGWAWGSTGSDSRIAMVQFMSSSDDILSTHSTALSGFPNVTWSRITFCENLLPPAGTAKVRVSFRSVYSGNITASQRVLLTGVLIERTNEVRDYFDGSYPDTDQNDYGWTGTPHASTSFTSLKRYLPLLRIEDRFGTAREDMTCQIQTKNYNFEVPGSYKVLFWWGLDAIFKANVIAQVSPVVFNARALWGQVRTAGHTWGSLRLAGRTWRFPLSEGENGVTTEVIEASGPSRKFVKFFKKLRFRQLFFRIRFDTDGSDATAPVQIFTISTYMAEKETVSKQVS